MAKTVQIHICHILASIGWHLLWPWCQNNLILQKKLGFSFLAIKKGEGSLHPRPKGRGIRDPPHSLCNKILGIGLLKKLIEKAGLTNDEYLKYFYKT